LYKTWEGAPLLCPLQGCPGEQWGRKKVDSNCRKRQLTSISIKEYTLSAGVHKESSKLENTGHFKEKPWVPGPVPKWLTENTPDLLLALEGLRKGRLQPRHSPSTSVTQDEKFFLYPVINPK